MNMKMCKSGNMKARRHGNVRVSRLAPYILATLGVIAFAYSASAALANEEAAAPGFEKLGAMIDVSRGRVLAVPYLKTRFERMGKMGYNAVMLYTEETYKLDGVPKWGYMRGGYTKDDIKELKAAADASGLELVPCIQTLGHLEKYLRWPDSAGVKCNRSTLIVGEPKTYELVDKMVAFWQETVGGSSIHIGMDEAWFFWEGEYQKRNGRRPKFDIFLEHLQKVCEICNRRGFTDIMIWSDMFYRMGSKRGDYYDVHATPSPELSAKIPEGVRLVYWDYYHDDPAFYGKMIDGHIALNGKPVLAGGIQTWNHFLHRRDKTLRTTEAFIAAAREKGCGEMWFTMWGDNGAYCIPETAEEGLFACAELAAGRTPEPTDDNCARFRAITGKDYAALVRLGVSSEPLLMAGFRREGDFLYDDPLYMANLRNAMERNGKQSKAKFAAWREKMVAASDAPDVPAAEAYNRALLTRLDYELAALEAWKTKDRAALENVAALLAKAVEAMREFCALYRKDWHDTSRPFGFELIQRRNAAALERFEEAKRRFDDFMAGRAATIEEFDEALQPFGATQNHIIGW